MTESGVPQTGTAGTGEPERCPNGFTDYEECFAPFRYCPIKGCGRTEQVEPETFTTKCPACGQRFTTPTPHRVVEHVPNEFGPAEHVFAVGGT